MCFDAEKLEKQLIKQPNPGNAFRHLLYIYIWGCYFCSFLQVFLNGTRLCEMCTWLCEM